MLSSNPHSGIYEAETSRTLDLNGGNPACNQGGIAIVEPVGCDLYNLAVSGDVAVSLTANTGTSGTHSGPTVAIPYTLENRSVVAEETKVYESHPMDSRVKELEDDVSPTVSVKWHKGAADTPLVCQQYLFENHSQDARYRGPLEVCPMLSAQMGTGGNNQPLVLCMAHGQANAEILEDKCPCLNCNHEQPIVLDRAFYNQGQNALYEPQFYTDGTVPTLVAKGPSAVCVRYIVRRLTPTECARLQGFPDRWGDIDPKEDFTDEEYRFWLEVRNTHAAINNKPVKEYNKKQMLTWYNKLHTDSAEYKMWGNGIALPCALYVMQGIQDALEVAV